MPQESRKSPWLPTLGLLAAAAGLGNIFHRFGRDADLAARVPEFITLSLFAGILYLISVYWVEKFSPGPAALVIILGGAAVFRLFVLPAPPSLSEDVYRYQWEGRVERAGLNPYRVFPALPGLAGVEDGARPIRAGRTTPSLYPPLSEKAFAWVESIRGYKFLFTALDLASIGVILLLLAAVRQPMHRVLIYAWNPTVVVAFAMCGHHDSMAILTLLAANLFIISQRPALSITSLALSFLSKYFPVLLVPVFLKRSRGWHAGIFVATIALGYLPFAGAGRDLFHGLGDFARGWEANDSLFRLIRSAGNSKPQAELVAGGLVLALIIFVLKKRIEPLGASLILAGAPLLVSPAAFPWYFTWSIPFLCFHPSRGGLLMGVTSVLGYAPVVAYAAGQPYRDSPLILALEYAPACLWLAFEVSRALGRGPETHRPPESAMAS